MNPAIRTEPTHARREPEPTQPSRRLDRQTHFVAGILLIAALSLASLVDGRWIYLALLPAFGLMLDALAGVCPMTLMLKKAPWNSVR